MDKSSPTSLLVAELKHNHEVGVIESYEARKKQLLALHAMISEGREELFAALQKDLHKSKSESYLLELSLVLNSIHDTVIHLKDLMKDETQFAIVPDLKAEIRKVSLGTVLIIGAWNYPIQLTLLPVVGALAGGNTIVLKPSEISSNCSKAMASLIGRYLDPKVIRVVEGGIEETTLLLEQPFNLIFFTGSTAVGKLVYKAAAKQLIPGGKSPVIIDKNVNLEVVARRVIWGKLMNCAQTCIAPDYIVLLDKEMEIPLIEAMKSAADTFYGKDRKDLVRIISEQHMTRLSEIVKASKAIEGTIVEQTGAESMDKKIFPLTFITGLTKESHNAPSMTQELFGPIFPIIPVTSLEEAIEFVHKVGRNPLSLYLFSENSKLIDTVKHRINAGHIIVNDTMMNAALDNLPFGGVGLSGMGSYHGAHSFRAFTRDQASVSRNTKMEFLNLIRYPNFNGEYNSAAFKAVSWALTYEKAPTDFTLFVRRSTKHVSHIAGAGVIFAAGVYLGSKL